MTTRKSFAPISDDKKEVNQKKLIKILEIKALPSLSQIENDYVFLIAYILELHFYFEDSEKLIKQIINQVLFVQLLERMDKINKPKQLVNALFEEMGNFLDHHSLPNTKDSEMKRCKSMIRYLRTSFAAIEMLPEENQYKKILKMLLQRKTKEEVAKECNLTESEITDRCKTAVSLTEKILKETNDRVANFFITTICELILND